MSTRGIRRSKVQKANPSPAPHCVLVGRSCDRTRWPALVRTTQPRLFGLDYLCDAAGALSTLTKTICTPQQHYYFLRSTLLIPKVRQTYWFWFGRSCSASFVRRNVSVNTPSAWRICGSFMPGALCRSKKSPACWSPLGPHGALTGPRGAQATPCGARFGEYRTMAMDQCVTAP